VALAGGVSLLLPLDWEGADPGLDPGEAEGVGDSDGRVSHPLRQLR